MGTVANQLVNDNATVNPFSAVIIGDADQPAQTLSVSVTLDTAAKGAFTTLNGFTAEGAGVYTFSGTAAVATSAIERGQPSDRIGCVRRFKLADGAELREQLLALSDLEQNFSYCLLDTPIPLFNYVAHVRLLPVTDGDRTFWHWECRFTTRAGEEKRLTEMVSEQIYQAGFDAVRKHLQEAA